MLTFAYIVWMVRQPLDVHSYHRGDEYVLIITTLLDSLILWGIFNVG